MKWTTNEPKKDGYYWIYPEDPSELHFQGPKVIYVEIEEDGSIELGSPGGDCSWTRKKWEEFNGEILYFSDEPIFPPEIILTK